MPITDQINKYSIQVVLGAGKGIKRNFYKPTKILVLIGVLGICLFMLPAAWSDTRFEFDSVKVAAAETRMWKAYYSNDHKTLGSELLELLHSQFGISLPEATEVCEPLAGAAMKFETGKSDYNITVLPGLELAYSRLKRKLGGSFDPKEAARAELDWWVARRTPGKDSVEDVGRLISHLYAVLFGEDQPAFGRAGVLRAHAAHVRDEGGALCNWDTVERLLRESYQALQEGLQHASNINTGQVTLSWKPNPEDNVTGYKIYYGNASGSYSSVVDVGKVTGYVFTALETGKTYYFVITAYNSYGSESGYSSEIVYKATDDAASLPQPQIPDEKYVLREHKKNESPLTQTRPQNPELVWLLPETDLTKHSVGPFTVKVQIKGIDNQQGLSAIPRIRYSVGTSNIKGYYDMTPEGENVWRFDIPDPDWNRYGSKSIHYQVKVFDGAGNPVTESTWKKELIDSFAKTKKED